MSYEQPPTTPTDPAPPVDHASPAEPAPSYVQPPGEVDPGDVSPPPPYAGYQPVHVYIGSQRSGIAATRAVGFLGRIIAALVFLPVIGGVIAGFAHDASDSVPDLPSFPVTPDPVLGSPGNPRPVVEGRPFTLGGLSYRAGWRVGKNPTGFATGLDLRATNPTTVRAHPGLRLMLMRGDTVAATVTCVLAGIDPGATETVLCGGADKLPASYDRITVATLF